MLIEAAGSYRFPARVSREQLLGKEPVAKPIHDTARRAQERLCHRYRKLARAGKLPTMITAAARSRRNDSESNAQQAYCYETIALAPGGWDAYRPAQGCMTSA